LMTFIDRFETIYWRKKLYGFKWNR
jgi:hypothetical protein